MQNQILSHIYFALSIIALILFVEIVVNFKRPLVLKIYILSIVFTSIFLNISELYCLEYGYNRWMIELPKTIISIFGLNLMSFLLNHKMKKYIFFISFVILIIHISVLSYFTFIQPIDQSVKIKQLVLIRPLARIIINIIFLVIFRNIYLKIKKNLSDENLYHSKTKEWARNCLLVILIGCIFNIILILLPVSFYNYRFIIIDFSICMIILFRPAFLNKSHFKFVFNNNFNKGLQNKLNEEQFISEFFLKSYYTKKDTSLAEFSKIMIINSDILSILINDRYGLSFIDLVNKYRVELFAEMIQNGKSNHLTIEALADKVGFGSRQSLSRAFKRFHGGVPSDLMRAFENPIGLKIN